MTLVVVVGAKLASVSPARAAISVWRQCPFLRRLAGEPGYTRSITFSSAVSEVRVAAALPSGWR
jgi:hypothetical protein